MRRWLRGLGALIALAGVLVGAPLLLLAWGRLRLWTWEPGFDDGSLLLAVLTTAGWLAWAAFTGTTILEAIRLLSGNRFVVNVPLLGGLQALCAGLVIAVVAMAASAPSVPGGASTGAGAVGASGSPASVRTAAPTAAPTAAGAGPTAAPTLSTAVGGVSIDDSPTGASAHGETVNAEYVVCAGDDLWSIAISQLGEGRRWREIADANPDALADPTSHLAPGTRLLIPASSRGGGTPSTRSPSPRRIVVEKGDTLSGLAAEHLDAAARWPEIARANESLVDDPDHIEVGWRLRLPQGSPSNGAGHPGMLSAAAAQSASRPPAGTAADAVSPGDAGAVLGSAPAVDAPAGQDSTRETPPRAEDDPAAGEAGDVVGSTPAGDPVTPEVERATTGPPTTPPSPQPTVAGNSSLGPPLGLSEGSTTTGVDPSADRVLIGSLSGLAAAGLVGGWQSRRILQHRARAPGRRVMQPDEELLRFHSALGRAQRPDHGQALDAALRAIARHHHRTGTPLAPLSDAVLEPEAVVFHWAESPGFPPEPFEGSGEVWRLSLDNAATLPPDATDPVAFPALVSLGTGIGAETVLVDVERSGVLGVAADHPELQHATIAAMAVELACASWAAEVRVTVVGGDGRLIRAAGGDRVQVMNDPESALVRIRCRHAERAAALGQEELRELRVDPNRAEAVAPEVFVFADPLDPDSLDEVDALLSGRPVGLAVILAVAADSPATWQISGDPFQPIGRWPGAAPLQAQAIPAPARAAVAELFAVADSPDTTPAPWWSDVRPSNVRPLPLREPEIEDTVDIVRMRRREPLRPTLRLLGPVELVGAAGTEPARSRSQLLEMCGWLLEYPDRTASQMASAMAVAEGTRRSNMSRLRSWLGQDPSGAAYLPDAYSGRIRLHPDVTSDAQEVRLLAGPGVDRISEGSLTAILDQVRGAVLADVAPGQWFWAEELRSDLESTVRDAGVVLAEKAMARGDLDLARWAAQRALVAAPEDELLLGAWIRAEHTAGHAAVVQRLVSRLTQQARILDIDLMPETVRLCQQVMEGAYRARRA